MMATYLSAVFEAWALVISKALLHSLWQGAVIAVITVIVTRIAQPSAALRSFVYSAGLIGIVIGFLATGFILYEPSPQSVPNTQAIFHEAHANPTLAVGSSVSGSPGASTVDLSFQAAGVQDNVRITDWSESARWAFGTYLLGVALMAGRLMRGLIGSHRLRSRAVKIEDDDILRLIDRMSSAIMLRVRPVVASSAEILTPAVIGAVKPMLLLPVGLVSGIPPVQLETILAHELAHLRRFDHLGLALQRLVETIAFYHPAVWWLSRKLDQAREEACDDLVLACGCDRADYAESLLTVNQWARTCHLGEFGLGAIGKNRVLKKRLCRILGGGRETRSKGLAYGRGLLTALALLLFGGVAWIPYFVKAQEQGRNTPESGEITVQQRAPRLADREREVINKVNRLVAESQALAKTEESREGSENSPSGRLMNEALELLDRYCVVGSHPQLLRLHGRVNRLAGTPNAPAYEKWIEPSKHARLAEEFLKEKKWQAAHVQYLKSFNTSPEPTDMWDRGYLRALTERYKFDEAWEFFRSRNWRHGQMIQGVKTLGTLDDYPNLPVPLIFSPNISLVGSRRQSGEAKIQVIIDTNGRASITGTVAPVAGIRLFSEKVQQLVSNWRFTPRQEAGVPVKTELELPIRYKTSLPSVVFHVGVYSKSVIEDLARKVSEHVITYGVCEATILARSDASYAEVIEVFQACQKHGANIRSIRETDRPSARIPAPPPPPPRIEITVFNGRSLILNDKRGVALIHVLKEIKRIQTHPDIQVEIWVMPTAESGFVEEVKVACQKVSANPLVMKQSPGWVAGGAFTDRSGDGQTVDVHRPNRDGQALLSASLLKNDIGDGSKPDQSVPLPILSKGINSLDGKSTSFSEISNWKSLARGLSGTNPTSVRLILKNDASFGYALDAFEHSQRVGATNISVSFLDSQ